MNRKLVGLELCHSYEQNIWEMIFHTETISEVEVVKGRGKVALYESNDKIMTIVKTVDSQKSEQKQNQSASANFSFLTRELR